MPDASKHLSPCTVARRLGVRDATIYGWIRSGELKAANLAAIAGRRPRFRIAPDDLAAFLARRAAGVLVEQKPRARRQKQSAGQFMRFI